MQASFLCGVHYEGHVAHQGWPVSPELYDSEVGQRTFDHFLEYAALADQLPRQIRMLDGQVVSDTGSDRGVLVA